MSQPYQLFAGLLLAILIAGGAYAVGALSRSGMIAAAILGTVIFGLGGFAWAVLLIAFFISSSLLSRMFTREKQPVGEKFSKGHRRDALQVLANGGLAGLCVVLHLAFPSAVWPWLAFAGTLAAANADTWATELGALSSSAPRLITRLHQRVPAGTSGGVSAAGTLAAALGATLIGVLSAVLAPTASALMIAPIAIAGLLGAIFDSLLGATVQAMYRCVEDEIETEQHPLHSCGAPTVLVRGWPWLNNDRVNLACATLGALMAIGIGAVAGWA